MTIASLVVNLEANAAEFHGEMEKAARRVENIGRRITRAGIEISKAVAPFAAVIAGGLAAAIKQSALVHGELAQAWERLSLQGRQLLRDIGNALTPAFVQLAQAKGGLIEKARQLVAWFTQLSPSTQDLAIKIGLVVAAIGPVTIGIGAAIRAFGALWSVLTMLAGFIGSVLGPVLVFLLSPIGLTIVAVGLLIAGIALLIRHWQQVKQFGLEAWTALKLGVINAVDGMLAAFEQLAIAAHLPGLVDTFTEARDSLGVMRLATLREGQALEALGKSITKLPLLPDWLRHPLKALGVKFPSFALPTLPPLPTLPMLQATDVLATMDTQMQANAKTAELLGSSYDLAAANAAAYGTAIDALIKLGIDLDAVIGRNGLTLRDLGKRFVTLGEQVRVSLGPQLASLLIGFAEAIGDVVSGATKSLKGFGAALLKVVGDTMVSLGAALITLGTAKLAAMSLNPFAAIAVGGALVAFGKALSNAANAIANPVGAGGGGGGGTAAAPAAAVPEPPGTLILRIDKDLIPIFGPGFVDVIAQAIDEGRSRNVIIEPA